MMKLSAFDVMLLIIAAVIVIKVCMRGFVAEFFSLAAFLAALGLGILFFRPLTKLMPLGGLSPTVRQIIAFFIIFIAVFLVVKLIQMLIAAVFKNQILASLDHALGFFLGIFEAYIVVVILLAVLQLQPFFTLDDLFSKSIIVRAIAPFPIEVDDVLYMIKGSGIL